MKHRKSFNSNKCGTATGYTSHYYYKILPPCEPCKAANIAYLNAFKAANPNYAKAKWIEFKKKNPNYKKDYHKNNPEQTRKDSRRRRARKRKVIIELYTESQVLELYGTNCHLCNYSINLTAPKRQGKSEGWEYGLHIDHIIPISKGGSDTLDNVRPAHALCNLKKGVR